MKKAIRFIVVLICFTSMYCCKTNADGEYIVISEGYEGSVVVVFDCPNGVSEKWTQGKRLYEVESNGQLCTQFKQNRGTIKDVVSNLKIYDAVMNESSIVPLRNELKHFPDKDIRQAHSFKYGEFNGVKFFTFEVGELENTISSDWKLLVSEAIKNCQSMD